MAGYAKPQPLALAPGWFDRLTRLLAQELAPTSRKVRTAFRLALIGAIGAGVIASCHVNSELGTYIVWLLVGAGPMMSWRKAVVVLIAEAVALSASVVLAGRLVEAPWLMLPVLFALFSFSTYIGVAYQLGAAILLVEVVSIDTFYTVVFAPDQIGWNAGGIFGGSVIAFGILLLFDNWFWPDRGEAILLESLGACVATYRQRMLEAANYYLDPADNVRPHLPATNTDLPQHMAWLKQAVAEGVSAYRYAILLASTTRVARIELEVERLTFTARQKIAAEIRVLLLPELRATVDAIAEVLSEIAREFVTYIPVGPDLPPPASRTRAREATDRLSARALEVRPQYIGKASPAGVETFAAFTDSLAVLTTHIDHLLDQPPAPAAKETEGAAARPAGPDPSIVQYSIKVGLSLVLGYLAGIISQRPELQTVLTTVLITALPSYGASVRKMILRIVGVIVGGVLTLVAIIIVSPNFETVVTYMVVVFVMFYISAYSSLTSGRISYAGKQIGTTFALAFTGLSPALDVYAPLWRIWAVLLGTLVAGAVTLLIWPAYAGDSLLPKLRQVIRDALALAPGGSASGTEHEIQATSAKVMSTISDMLTISDDAQLEGRTSTVNHKAIVEAAGTLRRISNRLASISSGRRAVAITQLDPTTEAAREAVMTRLTARLHSWCDFFGGPDSLRRPAAEAMARAQSSDELAASLEQFGSRVEENDFARVQSWRMEPRRALLAELHSMHRLELLVTDLNRWLAQIPGAATPSS